MRNLLVAVGCIGVVCIAALAGGGAAQPSSAADVKLMVYSDWPAARTFLGCLNCAATDPTSIWNPASRYGWTNADGVWSQSSFRYLDYRHLVCSTPLTARQPAVFNQHWDFYYTLTVESVRQDGICAVSMSHQGCAALRALCAGTAAAPVSTAGWTNILQTPALPGFKTPLEPSHTGSNASIDPGSSRGPALR